MAARPQREPPQGGFFVWQPARCDAEIVQSGNPFRDMRGTKWGLAKSISCPPAKCRSRYRAETTTEATRMINASRIGYTP